MLSENGRKEKLNIIVLEIIFMAYADDLITIEKEDHVHAPWETPQ